MTATPRIKFLNILEEAKYAFLMGDAATAEKHLKEALALLEPREGGS